VRGEGYETAGSTLRAGPKSLPSAYNHPANVVTGRTEDFPVEVRFYVPYANPGPGDGAGAPYLGHPRHRQGPDERGRRLLQV
jgi:hypothetical protein